MVKKSISKSKGIPSILHIIIGVSVIVIGVWIFNKMYVKKPSVCSYMERFVEKEHFNGVKNCEGTTKPYSLMFFFMETCPHCVEFKPVWQKFLDDAKTQTFAEKLCICDISAENDSLLEKYNVSSFPTVVLVKNGDKSVTVFEGQRTLEGLVKFVNQNVS